MTAPGSKCAIQAKAGLVGLSDAPQSRPYQTPHSAAILRATNLPLYRSGLQLRPVVLLGCNSRKKKNKGNQIGPASDSTQSSHLAGPASRIEAPMMNPARSLLLPPALGWGLLKRAKLQVPKPQHRHHCAWQYRVIGKVQDPIEIPSRCSDIQSLGHYVDLSYLYHEYLDKHLYTTWEYTNGRPFPYLTCHIHYNMYF